jgi:hypothetical protein
LAEFFAVRARAQRTITSLGWDGFAETELRRFGKAGQPDSMSTEVIAVKRSLLAEVS